MAIINFNSISGINTISVASSITVGTGVTITATSITAPTFVGSLNATSGPVLIGSGTSTGTASQTLQVTGGAYVSGSLGIGTTSPGNYHSNANQLVVGSGSNNQGITIVSGPTNRANIYFAKGTTGSDPYKIYIEADQNSDYLAFGTTATERVRIDSSGRITTPYQPAFHAIKTTGDTLTTVAAKLTFGTATYDVGSNYSDASDRFTAPVAGKYFFYCSVNVINSANAAYIQIRKNGSVYGQVQYAATNFPRMDFNPCAVFDMASGDYVEVFGLTNTGTASLDNAGNFGGYLLG